MANTTTSVVQISVTEESGKTKTFNIDNPKENLSLNEIRQKLQPAFNGRWWLGNDGTAITALKSANYSNAVKIPIEGSDVVIEVSPNAFGVQIPAGTDATYFTVTGSTVIGGYFTNVYLGTARFSSYDIVAATPQRIDVEYTLSSALAVDEISGEFNIVTEAGTVKIPLVIKR